MGQEKLTSGFSSDIMLYVKFFDEFFIDSNHSHRTEIIYVLLYKYFNLGSAKFPSCVTWIKFAE